jgi:DNA-binding CsgD family transcriptional regulator
VADLNEASFARLVERIYDSVLSPEDHDGVLNEVLQATNSHFMLMTALRAGEAATIETKFIGELTSRRLDGIIDYQTGAAASDPTLAFVKANPRSGSFATDTHLGRSAHTDHPHIKWNRHYVGNAHWSARFEMTDGVMFGVSLHARSPDEPHTAGERQAFDVLFRHMARAWRLASILTGLTSDVEATIAVNAGGKVTGMSEAAVRLVDRGDGFEIHDGELIPSDTRCRMRWREMVWQATTQTGREEQAMLLRRRASIKSLVATVNGLPVRLGFAAFARGALIRVVDPDAVPKNVTGRMMQLWQLTPAEARLLQALIENGFALRDAADQLGVTYATVRTHLASVFAKTETHSQPELMRLAIGIAS